MSGRIRDKIQCAWLYGPIGVSGTIPDVVKTDLRWAVAIPIDLPRINYTYQVALNLIQKRVQLFCAVVTIQTFLRRGITGITGTVK